MDWAKQLQDGTRNILVLWFGAAYIRDFMVDHFNPVTFDGIKPSPRTCSKHQPKEHTDMHLLQKRFWH